MSATTQLVVGVFLLVGGCVAMVDALGSPAMAIWLVPLAGAICLAIGLARHVSDHGKRPHVS